MAVDLKKAIAATSDDELRCVRRAWTLRIHQRRVPAPAEQTATAVLQRLEGMGMDVKGDVGMSLLIGAINDRLGHEAARDLIADPGR